MLKLEEEFINLAKKKLIKRKKISAAWLQTGSNITAEIMGKAGFDVLAIDMEHGPGDIMNLIQQLQAISKYDVTPIVRIPWNDSVQIKKILDAGVHGMIVPYIGTREEAEKVVKFSKYPLEGIRGIAPSPRAGSYGMNSMNYLKNANNELLLFVQIESAEGVKNIDEIVKVKEIDGIFIGPMDLATSMGHFCNPKAEEVQLAIKKVEEVALKNKKLLGTVSANFESAKQLYEKGYNMVIMMSDSTSLGKLALDTTSKFKEYVKGSGEEL